ncbi:hypothetical protein KC644_03645 [Candidatus Berkelbacteria bacterium]|nr:hypothetical protein [Candidatus Berkelbacteria bacterium]
MKLIKILSLGAILGLITVLPAQAAQVTEPNEAGNIRVEADQTVDDTLIGAGNRIDIRGLIRRNVFLAGTNIKVENNVGGDAVAAGETISITKKVDGDVIAAGRLIEIGDKATVGHDVLAFGAEVVINGDVSGDLMVYAGQVTINGSVFGNVKIGASNLVLGDQAMVGGNIEGQLEKEFTPQRSDQVKGSLDLTTGSLNQTNRPMHGAGFFALAGIKIFTKIYTLLSTLILGLVLYLLVPKFVDKLRKNTSSNYLNSLLIGLVGVIISLPVILALVVLTLTIPVAILVGLVLSLAWLLGSIFGYMWIGDLISSSKWSPMMALLAGVAIVTLISFLPILGGIIAMVIGLIGFGSVLSFGYQVIRKDYR